MSVGRLNPCAHLFHIYTESFPIRLQREELTNYGDKSKPMHSKSIVRTGHIILQIGKLKAQQLYSNKFSCFISLFFLGLGVLF